MNSFQLEEPIRINLSCVREPEDKKAVDGELTLAQGTNHVSFRSFDLSELAPFFRMLARHCEHAERSSEQHPTTIEIHVPES